jgi:VanZ family protein
MNKPVRRAWVPALLWLAVIAWESTPYASSEHTSRVLYYAILFVYGHISVALFVAVHGVLRKIGHCLGYGILSLLMLRAWWATLMLPRSATRLPSWTAMVTTWSAHAAVLALLSAAAVAGLDEWHQTFLPERTGTIRDVALDIMAAAFVQLLVIAARAVRGKQIAIGD